MKRQDAPIVRGSAIEQTLVGLATLVALAALVVCFSMGVWVLDRASLDLPAQIGYRPVIVAVNAMPGLLLAATLLLVTRRLYSSILLAFGVQALLLAANAIKLDLLAAPISIHDLAMLQHAQGLLGIGWNYVDDGLRLWLALGGLLWLWLYLRERPAIAACGRGRIALLTLVTACCAWIASGRSLPLYDDTTLRFEAYSPVRTVLHAGLVASLVNANTRSLAGWRPLDNHKLDQLATHQPQRTWPSSGEPPDIIMVQAESLFDPELLQHADQINEELPRLRELLQQGRGGRLQVPTFGGGTIRTEFEALTGIPLRALPDIAYPYLQLDNGDMRGLVTQLTKHGYRSTAIHPNAAATWGRKRVFQRMGFERFIALDEFPKGPSVDGYFVSDQVLMDQVIEQLADTSEPQFIFAITIEGHGPFDINPVADPSRRDAIPVPASLSPDARVELQNYLYHARNADQQLGRLLDAVSQRQRRSIVMLYGDHLPGFHHLYDELGFADSRDARDQPTTFVMIDSARPACFSADVLIAAWMLPSLLLRQAGLDDDRYFPLIGELGARLISGDKGVLADINTDDVVQLLDEVALARISSRFDGEPIAGDGGALGQ